MDETDGRRVHGIEVRGTIGILIQAAVASKLDLANALDSLAKTNFYLTPGLRELAVKQAKPKGKP